MILSQGIFSRDNKIVAGNTDSHLRKVNTKPSLYLSSWVGPARDSTAKFTCLTGDYNSGKPACSGGDSIIGELWLLAWLMLNIVALAAYSLQSADHTFIE